MTADGIVLEMLERAALRPGPEQPRMTLLDLPVTDAARFGRLYREVWAPLGGGGRGGWSDEQWAAELGQPGTCAVVARLADHDIGLAQIGWDGQGAAGFVILGVVPERQGQGLGGDLLSRLTARLWDQTAPNGRPTERVWLWTRPDEHHATVSNYLARGFVRGPDLP